MFDASSRSFWIAVVGALFGGIALCCVLYAMQLRELHRREQWLAEQKRELVPLKRFAAEVGDYEKTKDEFQKRIDYINPLKQNQKIPNWQFALISEALDHRGIRIDEAELTDRLAVRVLADSPADLDAARAAVADVSLDQGRVVFDSPAGDANWRIHLEKTAK